MTKEEIIRETVAFYNKNNRAVVIKEYYNTCTSARCVYLTDDKKMCAVGRCMTKAGLQKVFDEGIDKESATYINDNLVGGIDTVLKKKYHGHDGIFWDRLQLLHDTASHWDENGITPTGVAFIKDHFDLIL